MLPNRRNITADYRFKDTRDIRRKQITTLTSIIVYSIVVKNAS